MRHLDCQQRYMDHKKDLSAALKFVIDRIEEQAMRSGEPLTEEQRFLLNNLPQTSNAPIINIGDPEFPSYFVSREPEYEKLCNLAKAARRQDLALNPASRDWEFAFNVSKLNHHPMCWLLQWAGLKQRTPWWDRWLLVSASLLFLVFTMPLLFLVVSNPGAWWRWAVVAVGYCGITFFTYVASRRIEERQLLENIKNCRSASGCSGTLTG